MSVIPLNFLNAVVAIGIGDPANRRWIGTGFLVSRKEISAPDRATAYLITNKHVIHGQQVICIRFNSTAGELIRDYGISLMNLDGSAAFSAHPNDRTDIVAIQINPNTLINDNSIWGAFDLDDHTLTLEQMASTGVQEGSLVYALGFPMNLVDDIKAPICRLGCISRVMDAFVHRKGTPCFLVDAQVFPGNSGGPIISRPEYTTIVGTATNASANLIGILSSYIPYRESLISVQTGRERMVQEENSGLTVVHPVDRIKEVVELEWHRLEMLKSLQNQPAEPSETESAGEEEAV